MNENEEFEFRARSEKEAQSQQPNWKGIVGNAIKSSIQKPLAYAKDLGTNPESMANAMPGLLGTAGLGVMPWGGGTAGTAIGQGIRAGALTALGKKDQIPPMLDINDKFPFVHGQIPELGLAALGDVAAIPLKRNMLGRKIGVVEKNADVLARGAEKAITPGSVGQTLRDLEAQIDAGTINSAQGAKDAKEIVDQIYMNPKIYEKSPGINVQSARVSQKVQKLLNEMIPGRAEPAKEMAKVMQVPNMIQRGWRATPWAVKKGAQGAAGVLGVEELYRWLKGGR